VWRGVLLDVGRHFFPVPFILKLLDLLALYKMNRFHWHLTEDQVGGRGSGGEGRSEGRGEGGGRGGDSIHLCTLALYKMNRFH